jgi:hypothetical protein
MKMRILLSSFVAFALLLIGIQSFTFTSGGFGDGTGAPLKKANVSFYVGCNNTSCHSGNPINSSLGGVDVISNIPSTGWVAGETYRLTVKVAHPDRSLWGFQLMAWGSTDSMSVGNLSANKSLGDSASVWATPKTFSGVAYSLQYATHTRNCLVTGFTGKSEWTLNWKAPSSKTQNVYFYATGIAANGNGGTTGDYVYQVRKNADSSGTSFSKDFSTIPVSKLATTDIFSNETERPKVFKIYPTIVETDLNIGFNEKRNGYARAKISAISGVESLSTDWYIADYDKKIDVSSLPKGNYLITIQNGDVTETKKFTKL